MLPALTDPESVHAPKPSTADVTVAPQPESWSCLGMITGFGTGSFLEQQQGRKAQGPAGVGDGRTGREEVPTVRAGNELAHNGF